MVRPAIAATMRSSSALRGVLAGYWAPPISAHGSDQRRDDRAEQDQQLPPGAVQREPDRGQDQERREARHGPVGGACRISATMPR